jgi:hypothetical protein
MKEKLNTWRNKTVEIFSAIERLFNARSAGQPVPVPVPVKRADRR